MSAIAGGKITIGVVMATYYKEALENLCESVGSVLGQTELPDRFVVVADGPIPVDQADYLRSVASANGGLFEVIFLEKNVGCFAARNIGIRHCDTDFVAIMDSDDICEADRLAKQKIAIVSESYDVVGSWQVEFDNRTGRDIALKTCPLTDLEIKKSLRFRCLLPDPSVVLRRSLFLAVGGYPEMLKMGGDHILFMRMAAHGARFACVGEPLIRVRISPEQRMRRTGIAVVRGDIRLRWEAFRIGYISFPEAVIYGLVFIAFRLIPARLKPIIYRMIRRSPSASGASASTGRR